jgi:hypothetical protein
MNVEWGAGGVEEVCSAQNETNTEGRRDLAEDRALGVLVVMIPKAPRDADVAIRVTAVKEVAIVKHYSSLVRLCRTRGPPEQLFGPVHAQVIVQEAGCDYFPLTGIPATVDCDAHVLTLT